MRKAPSKQHSQPEVARNLTVACLRTFFVSSVAEARRADVKMISRVHTEQAGKFNRASTVGVSSYHSIHFSSQSDYGHLLEACIACKQSITAPHTDTIHRELKIKCEAFLITDVSQFLTTPSQFTTSRQPITSLGIHDKQTGIGWFPHCCPPRLPGWLSTHAARLVVSY